MSRYPNKFKSERSRKLAMRKRTGRNTFTNMSSRSLSGKYGGVGLNTKQMVNALLSNSKQPSLMDKVKAILKGEKK